MKINNADITIIESAYKQLVESIIVANKKGAEHSVKLMLNEAQNINIHREKDDAG